MPERPLVLFGAPGRAEKARRHGGPSRYNYPNFDRQVARISPKFQVLQDAVDIGNLTLTNRADGIEPEYTVVFETVGDPSGFARAIKKFKTAHPEIEWLMELSDECPADEDFYAINDKGVREEDKALKIKFFCLKFVITTSESTLISFILNNSSIFLYKSSIPSFVIKDIFIIFPLKSDSFSLFSSITGTRSILFKIIIDFLFLANLKISSSSPRKFFSTVKNCNN